MIFKSWISVHFAVILRSLDSVQVDVDVPLGTLNDEEFQRVVGNTWWHLTEAILKDRDCDEETFARVPVGKYSIQTIAEYCEEPSKMNESMCFGGVNFIKMFQLLWP